MKLRKSFIVHSIDNTSFLVPVGSAAFNGVVRSNESAALLLECLKEETTEETLVDALCQRFEAPRETVTADVREVLNKLREIDAIED